MFIVVVHETDDELGAAEAIADALTLIGHHEVPVYVRSTEDNGD